MSGKEHFCMVSCGRRCLRPYFITIFVIRVIGIDPCFITIYILSNLSFILFFVMHASFLLFAMHVLSFFFLIYRRIAQHLIFIGSPLHFLFYLFYSGHLIFVWSFYFLSCISLFIGVSNKLIFNLMSKS